MGVHCVRSVTRLASIGIRQTVVYPSPADDSAGCPALLHRHCHDHGNDNEMLQIKGMSLVRCPVNDLV